MTRNAMICAALLLAVPAAAQDQPEPSETPAVEETQADSLDPQSEPTDFDVAKKKVVDCEGEKFVFAWGAGARPTKVTLCSNKDATSGEIVLMLEEAAARLEGTASIPEDRRIMIVKQIRAKISELKKDAEAAASRSAVAEAPATVPEPPVAQQPLMIPQQPAPPAVIATPAPARPVPLAARPMLARKPRLSFECYTPGEIGSGGPCTILGRDTRLTVRAGEVLPTGIGLRFQRNGETRAEVALKSMGKGQSSRLTMPREVCSGVSEAESQIQVVSNGRVVDSIGPFLLRC